jgi:hypothetical protein
MIPKYQPLLNKTFSNEIKYPWVKNIKNWKKQNKKQTRRHVEVFESKTTAMILKFE